MKFFAFAQMDSRDLIVPVPEEFSASALTARGWVDKDYPGCEMALVVPRGAELRVPFPPDVLMAAKLSGPVRLVPRIETSLEPMSLKPPNRGLGVVVVDG